MKAIVLHGYGPASALRLETVDDPRPAAGEVLVSVAAAGLNPIDWKVRSGSVKERMPVTFPWIPGRDAAGVVRQVGEGVQGFAPDDRVMAMTEHAYAELCAVKAKDLARIPDGMDMTTAAALPLVSVTGDQLVRLGAGVQAGWTVVVTGALGAVGRTAVFAAAGLGARVIAGVRGRQLDEARRLPGVVDAVALDDPSPDGEAALAALGPLDAVADTVGGEAATRLMARLRPGGVYGSVVGPPSDPRVDVQVNPIFAQPDAAAVRRYAEAVHAGRLSIPFDRTLPLAHAAEGQAAAERGGAGKIVLLV